MADSNKKGRFTKYSNKIGLYSNSNGSYIKNDSEVVLNFPFKDTVLEAGMSKEDVGRDERFLHIEIDSKDIDTLEEPKVLTDFRLVNKDGEHKLEAGSDIEFFDEEGNLKQNLLIKGNNLLALHTLKEKLTGKVKFIYIDPPYNTGNDGFRYNDNFNHSAWLSFMKNRLEVAKELLTEDGVFAVQCDDNEQAYLRVLMDEIFGRENFVSQVALRMSTASGVKVSHKEKTILKEKEYIIIFKNKELTITPEYVPVSGWESEFSFVLLGKNNGEYSVKRLADYLSENNIPNNPNDKQFKQFVTDNADLIWRRAFIRGEMKEKSLKDPKKVLTSGSGDDTRYYYGGRQMYFYSEKLHDFFDENGKQYGASNVLGDLWNDINTGRIFNEGGVELRNGKKAEQIIARLLRMFTQENELILDYHLGSGTTSAVAHKMKRRWVGVEQMDYVEDLAKTRLRNVIEGEQSGVSKATGWQGGGSFIYFELKKYNQEFIDRIQSASSKGELDEVYDDMSKNAFLKFWFDKKEFEKDENFRSLDLDKRKQLLVDILDENQLYLNYADMNDARHSVSADEKALTDKFYGTPEN